MNAITPFNYCDIYLTRAIIFIRKNSILTEIFILEHTEYLQKFTIFTIFTIKLIKLLLFTLQTAGKGAWSPEHDAIILQCLSNGITKWSEIANYIPNKVGKQCRERYFNHLDRKYRKI